jgi:SAM-dependent methyltransferase
MTERYALKNFYEEVARKYCEEEEVYATLRGILRKRFVLARITRFRGQLLDIGCNKGMYLNAYSGGPSVGVDISLSILRKARRRSDLKLVQADAENLFFFRPGSFDHILCSEVIEHCPDPHAVFQGISHVLRPGGSALITVPNWRKKKPFWAEIGLLAAYGVRSPFPEGYIHTAYRPEELARMAEKAGLRVLETGTLEKDVKYAAKIPVLIWRTGNLINRLRPSLSFLKMNDRLFQKLSLLIYRICNLTGLDNYFLKRINEGVRSYILVTPE